MTNPTQRKHLWDSIVSHFAAASELRKAAIQCVEWRWRPGMREYLSGLRVARDCGSVLVLADENGASECLADACEPDLYDSATVGALLDVAREAWGDQWGSVTIGEDGSAAIVCKGRKGSAIFGAGRKTLLFSGASLAEALVKCLGVAPDHRASSRARS